MADDLSAQKAARVEYRVVYRNEGNPFARQYGVTCEDLEHAQEDLQYVQKHRDEAWIEIREVSEWRRVDG